MKKYELMITALQQRIGELVAQYELQIALLRADLTQLSDQDKENQSRIEEYAKLLEEKDK